MSLLNIDNRLARLAIVNEKLSIRANAGKQVTRRAILYILHEFGVSFDCLKKWDHETPRRDWMKN